MRQMVETFVTAHKAKPDLIPVLSDGGNEDSAAAAFYLQHGLRSLAGGNVPAAVHHFQEAKAELQQRMQACDSQSGSIACKMGAVCGCLGDAYRRMGDMQQAMQACRESVECLHPQSETNSEVAHALTVSLNRVGDLHYYGNEIQAAKWYYEDSLKMRRRLLSESASSTQEENMSQRLDVAACLIKVADACCALGDSQKAASQFTEARTMLQHCSSDLQSCKEANTDVAALQHKCSQYLQIVDGQLTQLV